MVNMKTTFRTYIYKVPLKVDLRLFEPLAYTLNNYNIM